MPFDPDAYLKKKDTSDSNQFDPVAYLNKKTTAEVLPDAVAVTSLPPEPKKISVADSYINAISNMATSGWGDELGGHMEALGSKIGIRGLGSPYARDIRLESDEEDQQNYRDVYEAGKQYRKNISAESEKQNPNAYLAGQITGGLLTVPMGGAILKGAAAIPKLAPAAAKIGSFLNTGSKTAQVMKAGALEGMALGAGESEGETLPEVAFDAAKGGAVGGLASGVFDKAIGAGGKLVKKGAEFIGELKPTQKAVEVIGNLAFDLPPKYTEALLKNSKLKDVRSMGEIEDALVETANNVKADLLQQGKKAWSLLDDKPAVMSDELADNVYKYIDQMKILGSELPSDKAAVAKAEAVLKTLGTGKPMSERDIKTIVQKLDREISWGEMGQETSNDLMKALRRDFDSYIKGNAAYQEQMKAVSEARQSLDLIERQFGFKKMGETYAPTDMTSGKLKNMFDAQGNVKKSDTVERLTKVDPNLVDEIKMRGILDRTEGGVAQGSRNVLTGVAIGGGTAGIPGMMAGAVGGYIKDKYGRKIGKEFIDRNRETILNRDEFFKKMGEKVSGGAQSVMDKSAPLSVGFSAAMVPSFIADQLSKSPDQFDNSEKRTVTKIYMMKQRDPNFSESDAVEIMKKTIPGYSRKKAADDF